MLKKGLLICLSALMMVTLLVSSLGCGLNAAQGARSVKDMSLFKAVKFTQHLRVPNEGQIIKMLEDEMVIEKGVGGLTAQSAEQEFIKEFVARNPDTPNPAKLKDLLDKERGMEGGLAAQAEAATPQIMSLAVPIEFPATETFTWCGAAKTGVGPLHNEIPAPGPKDNNTVWYEDATPTMYNELYFGIGKKAGVIIHHPNLGDVDLRGNTMANYYIEQSEGKFTPKGEVYPKWLQAIHPEAWYGADSCNGADHNPNAPYLVVEAVNAINSDSPGFSWQTYDGDGDGIVDNFTVIHAGMGQEGGGGLQGDDAIWSHASLINYPTGYKACSQGSTGCPDRDIFVREYSMDPENLDVGVISEEFGHAAFGLPDIYTTDAQGSPANWAIMEAGSWNGILGGMQPAPFPLWFRLLVGWAKPSEMSYTAKPSLNVVGQLSQRPKGTQYGLKINMPDQVVDVENPLGTGIAWWSDVADLADNTLTHTFNLTGTTAPVFSFNSYWSIEQDYDYGYVEVSTDGAAWTPLRDTTGKMVADVNGSYGLTGEDTAPLSFDLSAYAGQQIQLRLRYVSDIGVQWRGWWADDFALKDGAAILFTDDVEGATTWVTDTWTTVPLTRTYPMFYLVEWRNLSGFDQGLKYPYATVYNDDTQWQVDRTPYTVPGMLVWLRNARYSFDYTLYDSLYDPPSYGPKHALLVVDSHPYPLQWNALAASTAPARLTSRAQPSNATFTLQPTTPFTVRLGYNPITGVYQDTPVETKTFGPQPAVSQFHDSLGYYPGLWYRPANDGLYFWDAQSSLAVPAKGNYTTKITDISNQPFTDLYGIDLGDTVLGTGNPGDSAVQYGLNLAVVGKAKDGSWGAIEMWNSPSLTKLDMRVNKEETSAGGLLHYMITLKNLSPIPQKVVLDAPIPENTTFAGGMFYNRHTKSIHLETTLIPNFTFVVGYKVRVNSGTPVDTVITGAAQVKDDGLGAAAIATTTIVDKSSSYWKDAPDEGEGSTIFLPSIIN